MSTKSNPKNQDSAAVKTVANPVIEETAVLKQPASKTAAKTKDGLNLQQEEFCKLYVSPDRELFGNGAQCYLAVYGAEYLLKYKKPMNYLVALAASSRLLTKVNVMARINGLLEAGGFNDENVDKQHLFLINQHRDLKTKMMAIKEYNALKKRVTPPEGGGNTFNTIIFTDGRAARIARRILTGNSPSEESPR